MRHWLNAFVDLLFPRVCPACAEALAGSEEVLCTSCRFSLPRTDSHQTNGGRIAEKFYGKVEVASAHAYLTFSKGGSVQRLLHALKYRNQPEVGQLLGKLYGAELRQAARYPDSDLIIPVPLHRAKLRQRQYNQSDYFAEGLSEAMQIPWSPTVLHKGKSTDSQTRKSRFERFQNVTDAFEVTEAGAVRGRTLILVDDVITTGATLEAAARVLLASGARAVHVLTIATAQ